MKQRGPKGRTDRWGFHVPGWERSGRVQFYRQPAWIGGVEDSNVASNVPGDEDEEERYANLLGRSQERGRVYATRRRLSKEVTGTSWEKGGKEGGDLTSTLT